jgi:hypothetical protein
VESQNKKYGGFSGKLNLRCNEMKYFISSPMPTKERPEEIKDRKEDRT